MSDTTEPKRSYLPMLLLIGIPAALLALVLIFALGFAVRGCIGGPAEGAEDHADHGGEAPVEKEQIWSCSMHPQIRQPKPGLCPICNMDLIPLTSDGGEEGERVFSTSKASRALMAIQTTRAERQLVEAQVQMIGTIDYDETRVGTITARVPGRLDRLYVDYTGIPVKKGDHMVYLYSPQLLATQQELISAKRALKNAQSDGGLMASSARSTLEAVRDKLRLWDLSPEQIRAVEERAEPSDHMTIYAPMGGIVIEKHVNEGAYVQTGQPIYTIADLSRLWVKLDAYESDLVWLRYGQEVTFSTEAYPGETFVGRVAFIAPTLDRDTRTVNVRVNVENTERRLKPGMFVRAEAHATVAAGGRVVDPHLDGKYMCPMHPSVVKETEGDCDICGMPLESAKSLGYVTAANADTWRPLVIPASAPLITGERAVVYIELPNRRKPTFEGREVVLGPRAGDWYIVHKGLTPGDLVVTRGAFKIDSALQIQAKPSMMNPPDDAPGSSRIGTRLTRMREEGEQALVPQKTCPIMGGEINRDLYVDVAGKRIYMCCPGCTEAIKKDPQGAIQTLRERGEKVADIPGAEPETEPEETAEPAPAPKPEPKPEPEEPAEPEKKSEQALVPQKTCPIMGGKINRKFYVDAAGKRFYMCCPGCTDAIKKDPQGAIETLRKRGEKVADAPGEGGGA